MKKTLRNLSPEQVSFRAFEANGERYLEGYASVFNQRSKIIFENNRLFYEVINRNAFDDVLQSSDLNVILTFNHDRGRVMARTKSGTLELSTDDYGLKFKAKVPNTTLGNDVYELVSRGDLFENSFAFAVKNGDDEWTKDERGDNMRIVKKIARLYDVSVVVDGAYANTDIFARDEKSEKRIEPAEGETQDEFMTKCIEYVMEAGETDDEKQAYAMCQSIWDDKKPAESEAPIEENSNDELERMKLRIQFLKLKS